MSLTWAGALAWRMGRQLLDPVGTESVGAVLHRLGAVAASPGQTAELAVGARRRRHRHGEVEAAVAAGELIRTFAFRGATYLMRPEDAAVYLALRLANRTWERSAWRRHYSLEPSDWPVLREAVREAVSERPLTAEELGAAIATTARFRHLAPAFGDPSATLLKPLAWHGDLSIGAPRDGRATFQRLDRNPRWTGLRGLDAAGRAAVEAYLRVHGPASDDHLRYWLGNALGAPRQRLRSWIDDLGEGVTTVEIEGRRLRVMTDDLQDLWATPPSAAVRLLPGHDPWVLAAGTSDTTVVPPSRRTPVSRGANVVIAGGAVAGLWKLGIDTVTVAWFAERGAPPRHELGAEIERLATARSRHLEPIIQTSPSPR